MTEVALVKALSAFFAVDSILICPHKDLLDENVDLWTTMHDDIDIGLQVFLPENTVDPELFQQDSTMVYLTDEDCFSGIVDAVGLMSNVVWLAPDEINTPTLEYLRLDSYWITYSNVSAGETVDIVEHYGVSHERAFSNFLGSFSKVSGLNITDVDIWRRRNDLEGVNLINTVEDYPVVSGFVNDEHHKLDGILPDIIQNLQSLMNFTVTNVRTPDGEWGVEKEYANGTKYWSGLVGELVAQRAHFCIGGLTINPARGRAIDFSAAVVPETTSLAIGTKSVSTSNINTMAFVKVLSPST